MRSKGRVERANGTFQGRLVSELRLAGAATLDEANGVLEAFRLSFNQRFGVPAVQPESAYRPADPGLDLPGILCLKERRKVAKDNTVRYHGHTLQLFPDTQRLSYAGARVEVQERLDHRVLVCYQGKVLTPVEAPPLATRLRAGPVADPYVGGAVLTDFDPPASLSRPSAPASPLREPRAGDPVWCGEASQNDIGWELVKVVAVGQSSQQGKRVGRPPVTQRPGFPQQLAAMINRLDQGTISRRQAAKELDIGYATLKRLLDSMILVGPRPSQKKTERRAMHPTSRLPLLSQFITALAKGPVQGIIDPTDKIAEQ